MQLRVLQWNCRSINNKLDLHNYAHRYDIIIIIESWLKPKDRFLLKGFNTVRFDRINEGGGGIAIFIRDTIIFNKIELNLNLVSLKLGAITIDANFGEMLIVVCYRCQTKILKEVSGLNYLTQ